MPAFILAFYRVLPLVVIIIALVAVIFIVVFTTKGAEKAKEVVLKAVWWICAAGSAVFLVFTLYALDDGNENLLWFFGSCLITMLVLWLIEYICLRRFRAHRKSDFYIINTRKRQAKSKVGTAEFGKNAASYKPHKAENKADDATGASDSEAAGSAPRSNVYTVNFGKKSDE